jgi:hypothetical protein
MQKVKIIRGALNKLTAVRLVLLAVLWLTQHLALAQAPEQVVDLSTRNGVTQRFLFLDTQSPKATVILFTGGPGRLGIFSNGSMNRGEDNFLVRSRELFRTHSLAVIVVDAPSDRQAQPFMDGFRETPEHATDIQAVIHWARKRHSAPVWLIGTSRGTQSVAAIATQLTLPDGPNGIVLTSSILTDGPGKIPVPDLPLHKITIPSLVVHHKMDGCKWCQFSDIEKLMSKLPKSAAVELIAVTGGQTQGDPCNARGYHGYNGIEQDTVDKIVAWLISTQPQIK